MAKILSKSGIASLNIVRPGQVSQSIDAFTGIHAYDIYLSGSFNTTGSVTVSGSIASSGNISGSARVFGTHMIATNAIDTPVLESSTGASIEIKDAITASSDISASGTITMLTASIGGGIFTSASLAAGGGGGGGGSTFPFTGDAVITGSLLVSGSGQTITGSLLIHSADTPGVRVASNNDNSEEIKIYDAKLTIEDSGAELVTLATNVNSSRLGTLQLANWTSNLVGVFLNGYTSGRYANWINGALIVGRNYAVSSFQHPVALDVTGSAVVTGSLTVTEDIITSGAISSSGTVSMLTASIGGGTFTSSSLASAIAGGGGGGSAFPFEGDAKITGSLVVSSSNSTASLELYGSGSEVLTIAGSEGTLFSVDDDLKETIFSANDISGLPILQASASGEVYLGKSPQSLYKTSMISATSASATQSLCILSTSSYDGAFFDYTVHSASNARAGSIMAVWSASVVSYHETTSSHIGNASGIDFNVIISSSGASLVSVTDSTAPNAWKVKTIIKAI